MIAPHTPMAMLSALPLKVLRSSASAVGCSIAPKMPWSTRKAIIGTIAPDRPMAADAAAKPTTPIRKIFLWPNRSPILPTVIRLTASASRARLVLVGLENRL